MYVGNFLTQSEVKSDPYNKKYLNVLLFVKTAEIRSFSAVNFQNFYNENKQEGGGGARVPPQMFITILKQHN